MSIPSLGGKLRESRAMMVSLTMASKEPSMVLGMWDSFGKYLIKTKRKKSKRESRGYGNKRKEGEKERAGQNKEG